MDSSRLPWKVIEQIIDISVDHPNTLRSLSLTCRQLRRPSRVAMFGRVLLKKSDHVFNFVAFLLDNPELRPFVHTLAVTPAAFGPSLLYILPNLSSIECIKDSLKDKKRKPKDEPEDGPDASRTSRFYDRNGDHTTLCSDYYSTFIVHHASFSCFRQLGARIHTLRLSFISFPTCLAFAQLLLAFASLTCLVCDHVEFETADHEARWEAITRRLSERRQLKELTVRCNSLSPAVDKPAALPSPGELLFYPHLAPLVVESLVIEVYQLALPPHRSDWCQLRRLVLQLCYTRFESIVRFLEDFPNTPRLKEALIEWKGCHPEYIVEELYRNIHGSGCNIDKYELNTQYQALKRLDHTLLRFPHHRVTFVIECSVDAKTASFWACELGKYLPRFFAHGGLVIGKPTSGEAPVSSAHSKSHHRGVKALVVSPNSKWAATGSLDSTIILWNTANGTVAQRWVAHSYKPVTPLAFSPDSRYLMSAGDDGKVVISDLSESACRVGMLEGHDAAVLTCAWSPDGNTLVTGSEDGTARLWDATTFQQRAILQLKGAVACLAFSANGVWLACGSNRGECCIFNVTLCTLHRSLWISQPGWRAPIRDPVLAFDPTNGSTRLAAAPCGPCHGVKVVDVESGNILAHMGGKRGELMLIRDISFSPDGKLVLGVSATFEYAVYVWEASTGIELVRLTQDTKTFLKARFSPCGKYIASIANDETVRLWRTADGSRVARFSEHREVADHVAFSPDGRTLSFGTRNGAVFIQKMRDIIPAEDQDFHQRVAAHRTSVIGDPAPPTPPPLPSNPTGLI